MKEKAERIKVSERSYKLANKRIKKDIKAIIAQIDTHKTGQLTFDMIGRILSAMGVFQISYNNKPPSTQSKELIYKSKLFQTKLHKEKQLHKIIWELLKNEHNVLAEVFEEVMVILYDSHYASTTIIAERLESNSLFYCRVIDK